MGKKGGEWRENSALKYYFIFSLHRSVEEIFLAITPS